MKAGSIGAMMTKKVGRTRLEKLQRSWAKASDDERQQFLDWIGQSVNGAASRQIESDVAPIASGRYLTPSTVARIRSILTQRSMTLGDLSIELGLPPGDLSLARAFARNAGLRLRIIANLQRWLAEQA